MDLIVGREYYYLTYEEYTYLSSTYTWISTLFYEADNGYYYADPAQIDGTNYWDILMEEDLLNPTYYSKSNKPGGVL